jgi:phage shock protein PspC (stress-responsive transcriptional regulator)
MKKILSINIRGTVFQLDEDGYERLNKYLNEIYRHFKSKKGHEEIISDIENRIIELFQHKLNDKKQVITLEDVNEVIAAMGHPSDFDNDSEEEQVYVTAVYEKGKKRLFRDRENGMIAGVCAGLSAYFDVDKMWFRIAFLVAFFVGGSGILVYLILWIAFPPARTISDRIEMQGDPVTISNIEKAVKEEMYDLKEKIDEFAGQVKETFKKKN